MAKAKQALFRRSPFLISYWNAGKLIFENYATGKGVTAAPLATEVLDFFSRWRSADAIFRKLPRYSPSSLRAAIRGLARHTLLQRSDRKPHPMERAMAAWSHWNPAAGFFHFTGRDLPFTADLLRTGRYMEELTREKAMPVPVKRYPGAEQTRLLPAHENGEFPRVLTARRTWRRFALGKLSFADLSTLLGLTFGVREWVAVPPLGRFAVKTSPSGGALHPIEAYVVARDVEGISPGNLSLRREQAPAGIAAARDDARPHVRLRDRAAVVFGCLRICSDDGSVHADAVEIQVSASLSGGAGGVRTSVPDVLPDRDVARAGAFLHDGAGGFED